MISVGPVYHTASEMDHHCAWRRVLAQDRARPLTAVDYNQLDMFIQSFIGDWMHPRFLLARYSWEHSKWRDHGSTSSSTSRIELSQKSHNVPDQYPTRHHFVTEMCTCVHISVTNWCIMGYLCHALWDSWRGFIRNSPFSLAVAYSILAMETKQLTQKPPYQ